MQEIRLGTIGSGSIVHAKLDIVSQTEGIRLTAVYSRSEETGAALATKYGAKRVYTDMDEFLADEEMNFVYVATPNLLHYEQAKKALLAGKNVILEKPFTTKVEQARELAELAREQGLLLIEGVSTAFMPNLAVIKEQIPKIGRIRLVVANYSQYSARYDLVLEGETPNMFSKEFGGGCLVDINYYNVYLNVALFGKPQCAVYYPNIWPGLADTSGSLVLCYDDFISQNAGAKDTWGINSFQIEGEDGYIYVTNGPNGLAEVRVVTREGEEILNDQPNPNRYFYEIRNMTRMILSGDYQAFARQMDITLAVTEVLEQARKDAGIYYPND